MDDWLELAWRPFAFRLPRQLVTAQGALVEKRGWLLRLQAADGRLGWGEAAPLEPQALGAGAIQPPGSQGQGSRVQGHQGQDSQRQGPLSQDAAVQAPFGLRPTAVPADGQPGDRRGAPDSQAPATGLPTTERQLPAPGSPTAPLTSPDGFEACAAAITDLGPRLERRVLEQALPQLPRPLAFALGLALAELDGLGSPAQRGWLAAPPSAELLPAGAAALTALDALLQRRPPGQATSPAPAEAAAQMAWDALRNGQPPGQAASLSAAADIQGSAAEPLRQPIAPITVKWKVAAGPDAEERAVLEQLLARLPAGWTLRLDANGGWDRATAQAWAERLAGDPRLDWLEQPLSVADPEGLERLAALVPVALDESLMADPALAQRWSGWQVIRPASAGDPRPLLAALQAGTPNLCLSTALETGIGRRLLAHLAALQAQGPTPTAPGLAPGWRPRGDLFAGDPERVWQAVG